MTISISPFDNYYKFRFVKSGPSSDPIPIDLSISGQFNISFVDPIGNKIQVPALDDKNIANPALGELAFKIDESIATKVLQINDRRFFITNGISINVATTTATTKDVVSVNPGVSSNVLEKRLEEILLML